MAVFVYKAIDRSGAAVRGTVGADSPRQARDLLRARGLKVHETAAHRSARSLPLSLDFLQRRKSGTRVATAIRELSTLSGVGIPLLDALDTVAKQQRGPFQSCILLLRDRIAAGASLSEAMAEQPHVFDSLCIHMVDVGENSGNLDKVLEQLAEFKERSLELKDRVITALMYPALVLVMSIAVSIFLMTVVTPMLLSSLLEAGRPLPWPTRVLKGLSDFLLDSGWWLTILLLIAGGAVLWSQTTVWGRRLWHRALLKLPVLGPMAQKQAIARMAMVIATLIKSGIVLIKSAEIAARATRNVVLREALERAATEVGAGRELGPALEQTEAFPPLVVQVFSVGQQTGRLEEMLDRLAADYDRQVTSLSTRLASVLEPVLILALAVLVGFIMFATILPILEAGNVL